jgi:hypothetical protein
MMTKLKMELKEQIKSYEQRINDIEGRIENLSHKGAGYSTEMRKRKSMISNLRHLRNKCNDLQKNDVQN